MKLTLKGIRNAAIPIALSFCVAALQLHDAARAEEDNTRTLTLESICFDTIRYSKRLEDEGFILVAWGTNENGMFSLQHHPKMNLYYLALTPYGEDTCVVYGGETLKGVYADLLHYFQEGN